MTVPTAINYAMPPGRYCFVVRFVRELNQKAPIDRVAFLFLYAKNAAPSVDPAPASPRAGS